MIRFHLFVSFVLLRSIAADIAADRAALLRLRDAVRGRTLTWNAASAAAPCVWEGVECDNATNRVAELRLPGDGLTGGLPPNTVGNLTELRVLSLRRNSLSGELPSDLASLTLLQTLHLQGNQFSGDLPGGIFRLTNLAFLNLADNRFSGSISPEFNRLSNLKHLYLQNNAFAGPVPELDRLPELTKFNVSFNSLTGEIPAGLGRRFNQSSFLGTSLCGGPGAPCADSGGGGGDAASEGKLSGGAIAGISIGSLLIFIILLVILFIVWSKFKTRKILPQTQRSSPTPASPENPQILDPENPNLISDQIAPASDDAAKLHKEESNPTIRKRATDGLIFFGDDVEVFTLEELLRASAEVIGKGTVGSTYKAYFDSGVEVIVKRLKFVSLSEENFRSKIEEVGALVHDHLEPLRGYFYGRDEKLLLYEPMPNGSLARHLHGEKEEPLSWKIRAKIALGAARGIAYLHSISGGAATSHGNIKSSNIFLTEYYNARVSEFGLTQLVSPISILNGYRAPEVSDTRRMSQQADVYAFGVLILELVTGKSPDTALVEEGTELPNLVESVGPEKWKDEIIDPSLVRFEYEIDDIVQFVHLAVACTGRSPDRRPSMAEVVRRIEEICG
ncbi:probable inactive receptor kinase At1g48480 [Andrographis paniculata]|uniref:probable inactive receptor kinase At1g48480 n=1 Tax=Andrographis paniculata TaxID=175694 RepID=UPI0021E81E74|nr:probable inactive receptor kinase At1g48480 [Andrographis paniculata]